MRYFTSFPPQYAYKGQRTVRTSVLLSTWLMDERSSSGPSDGMDTVPNMIPALSFSTAVGKASWPTLSYKHAWYTSYTTTHYAANSLDSVCSIVILIQIHSITPT